jgi:hypothetical protein
VDRADPQSILPNSTVHRSSGVSSFSPDYPTSSVLKRLPRSSRLALCHDTPVRGNITCPDHFCTIIICIAQDSRLLDGSIDFKEKSTKQINAKLNAIFKNAEVWLRVGVTRPYEGWCWLQVTGIYTFPDYLNGKCFADFQ